MNSKLNREGLMDASPGAKIRRFGMQNSFGRKGVKEEFTRAQLHVKKDSASRPRPRRWLRSAALLALLGLVVIGHGCHGEHVDDELSAPRLPHAGEQLSPLPVEPILRGERIAD
jgi:hypothetical protein